jgi:predicted component of type VI protein secretion system
MALRMRVISEHRQQMGDKSTFVFGVSGGSIGRSAENDWVLPDDMRYVSGRHARIVFTRVRYLAAGHLQQRHLRQRQRAAARQPESARAEVGDILRIGEYHVQVQIDSPPTSPSTTARSTGVHGLDQHRRRPAADDLGACLRLENLLEPAMTFPVTNSSRSMPSGRPVSSRTRALHQTQDVPKESSTAPELDVDSGGRGAPHCALAKAAAKQQQALQQSSPPRSRPAASPGRLPPRADNTPGLQAFCRGAGIGPRHFPSTRTRACCTWPAAAARIAAGPQGEHRSQQEQRNSCA